MRKFIESKYKIIIGLILSFMAVVSLLNAWNDSAIFDETAHIGAAYSYLDQREIRLNPEHPPIIKNLSAFPLLFLNLNFDINQPFWTGQLKNKWDEGQWASGRHILYQAGNNPDKIIFWARVPIVLLSLILGWFLFKWGRELAGTIAGLIALALYAFDPNILGHNHFVTTDLGIAAFFVFAFYFYLRFIKNPDRKNTLLAGLFLGLLMVAKFSFFVAFPVFGLVTVLYPLMRSSDSKNLVLGKLRSLGEYIVKGALIFLLAMLVVWVFYAFNTSRMSPETTAKVIDANFSPTDSNEKTVRTNQALHWLNANALTRPLTVFGIGTGYVFRRVAGGNGAYFLGEVSNQAFPLYFPVVFAIKEPLPSLLLFTSAFLIALGGIMAGIWRFAGNAPGNNARNISRFFRSHITEISLLLFIAIYTYISVTGNLNIGFRHLFPILPFVYLLTARTLARLLKNIAPFHKALASYAHNSAEAFTLALKEKREKQRICIFSAVFLLLFVYLIIGTVLAYPYYMSYFNEAAGGPKKGYRFVTDSNADWGQDLKRLKIFLEKHPEIDKIRVDYFGGGDVKTYIGDKYVQWWDSMRPIEPGWYAISANFLMGSLYDKTKKDSESYRWLKNHSPRYQVGTSILIYSIQ